MKESVAKNVIIGISLLVPTLVTCLFYINLPTLQIAIDLKWFPRFHAILNTFTSIALLSGLFFILSKKPKYHQYAMMTAFGCSTIFLVSYVFYHASSSPTLYGGEGVLKYIYYFVLITHVILAALILPFILFTFFRALQNDFIRHKKIARYTFPIWLYVAVSGVLVYFLISPYYS